MAKRRKHKKLPNGYGQIRYLGKNRRNPYGVYPPATEEYPNGQKKPPKALCYVSDWYVGFAVLTAYRAGTYTPGMESDLARSGADPKDLDALTTRILADYNNAARRGEFASSISFAEVYEKFFDWKFNGKKKYSQSAINGTRTAYRNCAALHDKPYADITYRQMQDLIDNCPLKYSSLELILSLLKQMARYAAAENIIPNMHSVELLKINIPDDDEHGVPFSDTELEILWKNKNNPTVELILILCYSGFRIGEIKTLQINLEEGYFQGGIKTDAGRDRIVPIHSCICSLVEHRISHQKSLLDVSTQTFRTALRDELTRLQMDKHTPHDCRHTFSRLCEKYKVRENDQKRMLGHAFQDVTNKVYGHRELEDLRVEIEKIQLPKGIC